VDGESVFSGLFQWQPVMPRVTDKVSQGVDLDRVMTIGSGTYICQRWG
jgi:hypothetical protein